MAKRMLTRETLAKKTAYLTSSAADHRVVFGPFVLRPMDGQFELYYSTRDFACTVEILDTEDEAAIDAFIAYANRRIQRAA
jgi:hypothetical protein